MKKLFVYGRGTATSRSAGWSFCGIASNLEEALAKWPEATHILMHAGGPNQKCVWTNRHGILDAYFED